jgi:hypothetical protein
MPLTKHWACEWGDFKLDRSPGRSAHLRPRLELKCEVLAVSILTVTNPKLKVSGPAMHCHGRCAGGFTAVEKGIVVLGGGLAPKEHRHDVLLVVIHLQEVKHVPLVHSRLAELLPNVCLLAIPHAWH